MFKEHTPPDDSFADFYLQRAADYERALMAAEADAEPVPDQEPPFRKSMATIAFAAPEALAHRTVRIQIRPPPSFDHDGETGG